MSTREPFEMLRPASLSVRVKNFSISEFTGLPISRALMTVRNWELNERETAIAGRVLVFAPLLRPDRGVFVALWGRPWLADVTFEPFPAALRYLRRHLELNGVENTTVVDSAVSDAPGTAHFRAHAEITMGRLAGSGDLSVDVVRLDDVCSDGRAPVPDLIKIDVEGEELKVLRGAVTILRYRRPTILLATHGAATHRAWSRARCCAPSAPPTARRQRH